MKRAIRTAIVLGTIAWAGSALAYKLECSGNKCDVSCDDGTKIGTMFWNGTQWSDGVRADPDKHVVAQLMAKAWGSSCL